MTELSPVQMPFLISLGLFLYTVVFSSQPIFLSMNNNVNSGIFCLRDGRFKKERASAPGITK